MLFIFYTSFVMVVSVWILYPLLLRLALSKTIKRENLSQFNYDVSVIIAAHNEAKNLEKRCKNIFSQSNLGDIEIIIASDGSSDETVEVVAKLTKEFTNIIFIDIQPQEGRSNAHNLAVEKASYDILVFTDAETVFDENCIEELLKPLSDKTGFVSGALRYFNADSNIVSQSVNLYWKLEMFLRKAESKLGLHATGTGACCAVRKSLYRTIPATGDIDFITPLDVVLQGYKCVHADTAVAWDELPNSPEKEFATRIRMTSKNIKGTLQRWGLSSVLKHPFYTISLFFHKIGRWLTPFFLINLFISNLLIIINDASQPFIVFFTLQVIFYLLGLLGYLGIKILYSRQIYSFLLANLGFLLGVLKAIFGNTPHLYKPVSQQKN